MFSTRQKFDYLYYAVALAIFIGYLWHCLAINYVVDDSFISFRYVKNFVNGNGLVYNPGERVEGYTNFLWVMILSGFLWLIPDANLLHIAQALGIIFGFATIFLAIKFSCLIHRKLDIFCLVSAAFLALNSGFCAWSTSGMETILFTFLIFLGCYLYVYYFKSKKKFIYVPILFGLAALTRPEGVLFFGITSVHMIVREYHSGKKLFNGRMVAWFLVFAAVYLPYYLWRFNYYGYPLPNTFYAKVGTGVYQYLRGFRYIVKYLIYYGIFPFLLPLPLIFKKKKDEWIYLFFFQVAIYVAYIIYVGGDGMGFYRFVVPLAPFIYILVQEGLRELYDRAKQQVLVRGGLRVHSTMALLIFLLFVSTERQSLWTLLYPESQRWYEPQCELFFPGDGKDHSYLWFENYFVDRLALAAKWLEENAEPEALVASSPAGSIAYHMNLKVLDMLGLNDIHIAHTKDTFGGAFGKARAGHEKGDGAYILSKSPDYILMGNVAVLRRPIKEAEMSKKLVFKSEQEIWANPDFHRHYEYVSVKLNDEGVFKYFTFYKRKSVDPL
jgi:arabinofuranosyltransferase